MGRFDKFRYNIVYMGRRVVRRVLNEPGHTPGERNRSWSWKCMFNSRGLLRAPTLLILMFCTWRTRGVVKRGARVGASNAVGDSRGLLTCGSSFAAVETSMDPKRVVFVLNFWKNICVMSSVLNELAPSGGFVSPGVFDFWGGSYVDIQGRVPKPFSIFFCAISGDINIRH